MQFSRDPFNLKNKYSRKYEGLVADKVCNTHAELYDKYGDE